MKKEQHISVEVIQQKIFLVRGMKVMLDNDLAELYQIETFNLNKAVKRNRDRFPDDFMIQLTAEEFKNLIFHFGISSWGGTRKLPFAFTEQGVAMLSSVLRSKRAVQVNIVIMRAFVVLRSILASHKEFASKLNDLERKFETHDGQIKSVFDALRQLMSPPLSPKRRIGFHIDETDQKPKSRAAKNKTINV